VSPPMVPAPYAPALAFGCLFIVGNSRRTDSPMHASVTVDQSTSKELTFPFSFRQGEIVGTGGA